MQHEDCDDDDCESDGEANNVDCGEIAELLVQDPGGHHHEGGEEHVVDGTHLSKGKKC